MAYKDVILMHFSSYYPPFSDRVNTIWYTGCIQWRMLCLLLSISSSLIAYVSLFCQSMKVRCLIQRPINVSPTLYSRPQITQISRKGEYVPHGPTCIRWKGECHRHTDRADTVPAEILKLLVTNHQPQMTHYDISLRLEWPLITVFGWRWGERRGTTNP